MTEINIPFNDWSKGRLQERKKWATSRNKRYGMKGDTFTIDDERYELTLVKKIPLFVIARDYYDAEGCSTENEFIELWKSIHPKLGWTKFKEVWIHFFKML